MLQVIDDDKVSHITQYLNTDFIIYSSTILLIIVFVFTFIIVVVDNVQASIDIRDVQNESYTKMNSEFDALGGN